MAIDREMIKARCEAEMITIVGWETTEDGEEALLGRWAVIADDDQGGLFVGDEGVLRASVVGAERYGNRRVSFHFTADEMDSGVEVRDFASLEPVEAVEG